MMAIKASLAGSRADCVRERLRDCGPGAIQRRPPRREGRFDVDRRLGQGGGQWACSDSNAVPPFDARLFRPTDSDRHAAPGPCPPDELRFRMAVRPTRSSGGAVAQAFLGLAADPLDPVQQREARERSGIAGRRTVEEEKHEKGDASQQGEPGDRHMPSQVASEEATRSFYAQAGSLLRSCGSDDAQAAKRRLLATRRCEVFWRVVAGEKNGSSIAMCQELIRHRMPLRSSCSARLVSDTDVRMKEPTARAIRTRPRSRAAPMAMRAPLRCQNACAGGVAGAFCWRAARAAARRFGSSSGVTPGSYTGWRRRSILRKKRR